MDSITVIFVLSKEFEDESQASEIMLQAFEACQQNKVNTTWVKEQDIYKRELKKTDFIVFDQFDGKHFELIKEAKSASILGPWCILVCLMEGKKIPNFQWPIFNVAMYDCVVTSSHLPRSLKAQISEKVQWMGGCYGDVLAEITTVLIADSVKSAKYMKAIEMNIKVVTPSWVDAVWEASLAANIHCNDKIFDRYKCPPLHKLIISTTGFTSLQEREEVRKMITENGGQFTGKLNLKTTDFLICQGEAGAMSEKYKEARKTETVTCVTLQWLLDSIKKGYCVPHYDYAVKRSTSTPQKNDYLNPNFSTISAIDQSKCERSSIEETILKKSTNTPRNNSTSPSKGVKRKVFTECDNLIQQMDVKKVRKSEQCLDGCSIYLVGFNDDHREKLCKIINASGATRCDDISDRVTHVLVGDPDCHELKLIKSKSFTCSIVSLQWLLDSIERRRPCGEESYLVNNLRDESNFKSPIGKKGLSLLRSNRTITEIDLTLSQKEKENLENEVDTEAEREIMKHYMMPEPTAEEDTLVKLLKNVNYDSERLGGGESQNRNTETESLDQEEGSQTMTQHLAVFRGLNFLITNFDDVQVAELHEQIQEALGCITTELSEAHYVVAPCFITEPLDYDPDITINDLWIYDSINDEELVSLKYYHRPLLIRNTSVLEDCVISISAYSGYERNFLSSLIVMLGGVSQEQFCRITSAKRNVVASTHLVTAEAIGKKYEGALKWGLPAVDKNWLVKCATSGTKLPEQDFLVSENTALESSREKNTPECSKTNTSARNTSDKNEAFGTEHLKSASLGESFKLNAVVEEPPPSITPTNAGVQEQVSTNDNFTVPPPRKYSIGRPEARTPKSGDAFKTPERNGDDEVLCSQVTPVDKIMRAVRMTNLLGTPDSPPIPKLPWDVDTPETPYGLCFGPNPSKSLRKECLRLINMLPDKPPTRARRMSTPLTELKRRLLDKIGSTSYANESQESQDKGSQKEDSQWMESPEEVQTNKPLSKLKRSLWGKMESSVNVTKGLEETQDEEPQTKENHEEDESEKESTQSEFVNTKLQQLEEMMASASGSASKSRRQNKVAAAVPERATDFHMRESQPCTVQWDFGKDTQEEPPPESKIFMISGVADPEVRAKIASDLRELGGTVSENFSYDPSATHLLCPKPARNEKTLSCMSAGKWILHVEYVAACVKAGKFLKEEDYEFGNPNSLGKITIELDRDIEIRMQAIYYWRNQIAMTGRGPFQDMRAIVIAEKKQALVSVIEAGGGIVIEASPPFNDVVHATHCLMEPKLIKSYSLYEPLAKQGIYCINTVYLSDFLHRTNNDIKDCILPFYQKYFR